VESPLRLGQSYFTILPLHLLVFVSSSLLSKFPLISDIDLHHGIVLSTLGEDMQWNSLLDGNPNVTSLLNTFVKLRNSHNIVGMAVLLLAKIFLIFAF